MLRSTPLPLLLIALGALVGPARAADRLYLPVDAEAPGAFRRIGELGRRGQWDRVVVELDKLLAAGGAQLVEHEGGWVSVRAEARRRLLGLPAAARPAYDLIHDGPARALFVQGTRGIEPEPLERLLRDHPASRPWADRARALLGARYLEAGRPAAALEVLEPGLARAHALAWLGRRGEAERALPAGASVDALPPAAHATASAPLAGTAIAWQQPVVGYYRDGSPRFPWSRPEADAETAYAHDGSHVRAIDAATGKLRWRTALSGVDAFRRPKGPCGLALTGGWVVAALPGDDGLVGLERATGRVAWRTDLARIRHEAKLDFPASVSGVPIAFGGRVFLALVTEHAEREVHVVALRARDGRVVWRAFVASQSGGEPPRIALADTGAGLAVATGLGAVAGLDPTGELEWIRTYASARDGRPRPTGPFGGRAPQPSDPRGATTVAVTPGLVWVAPADAAVVLALDARTGELKGKVDAPRGRLLGVATVGGRPQVIGLSGHGELLRIDRAKAQRVGAPVGQPVAATTFAGDSVYVPTASGVVAIELTQGEQRTVAAWEPLGGPGDLVAVGGRLVVAAPGGLTALGPAPAPPLPLEGDPAAALGSAEWAVREAATAALRAQGTEARPRLTAAAADPDPEVAARAGALLSDLDRRERQVVWAPRIRPEWAEAIPDLLARITHEHPEVRLEALGAVTALDDPAALDLTRELLTDPDPRVALVAAATLLERGDRAGIEVIRAAALKGPVQDRIRAVALLSKHGEGEDAAVLGEACGDDDARVRALAARGALAQGKEALLGRVAPLLHDEDERVRLAVIGALQHVSAEAATPLLAEAVRDPNDAIRAAAVATLTGIASGDAYGALGLALGDSIRETARAAAAALYHVVQTRDALMIPPEGLEAGAGHDDPAIRNYVAQITLRFVDEGGVVSAATLAKFVGDEEPGIRSYSIGGKSWGQLLLEQAKQVPLVAADVEALGELALAESANARIQAYQVLSRAIAGPGRGAVVAQGLADAHPQIRADCAKWLLGEPGLFDAGAARAAVQVALGAEREEARQAASALLDRAPVEAVVPALLPLLEAGEAPLRQAAGERLQRLAGGAVTWTAEQDPAAARRAFAVWWWIRRHPDREPAAVVLDLTASNPSVRWRAAQQAAELPTDEVIRALAHASADEKVAWVLETQVRALAAIAGRPLDRKRRSRDDWAALAQELRAQLKASEEGR